MFIEQFVIIMNSLLQPGLVAVNFNQLKEVINYFQL